MKPENTAKTVSCHSLQKYAIYANKALTQFPASSKKRLLMKGMAEIKNIPKILFIFGAISGS
jgi:hypothetical protein